VFQVSGFEFLGFGFRGLGYLLGEGGGLVIGRLHLVLVRHPRHLREREFFIDNLLVRIHFIVVMVGWTGLAVV